MYEVSMPIKTRQLAAIDLSHDNVKCGGIEVPIALRRSLKFAI